MWPFSKRCKHEFGKWEIICQKHIDHYYFDTKCYMGYTEALSQHRECLKCGYREIDIQNKRFKI